MVATSTRFFFFFNDTATTEIYTLSLHDALPIFYVFGMLIVIALAGPMITWIQAPKGPVGDQGPPGPKGPRSEEHTSELQSRPHLVCRLLLEKKKQHAVLRHPAVHHAHPGPRRQP